MGWKHRKIYYSYDMTVVHCRRLSHFCLFYFSFLLFHSCAFLAIYFLLLFRFSARNIEIKKRRDDENLSVLSNFLFCLVFFFALCFLLVDVSPIRHKAHFECQFYFYQTFTMEMYWEKKKAMTTRDLSSNFDPFAIWPALEFIYNFRFWFCQRAHWTRACT